MFVDKVLGYASECYGFDLNNIESINSGTNKVYKLRKDGKNFYLRISSSGFDDVSAEIHWIEYLKNGITVPESVISSNGRLIETFQDDGELCPICMFRELPGVKWKRGDHSVMTDKTYFNWGRTMGRMHRLTKSYQPPEELPKRRRSEENFSPLGNYVARPLVHQKMSRIQNEISSLPKDSDSYGLIHADMQQLNFLINENDISVLDFDSCNYGFFAHDIGVALYHAIWWDLPDDGSEKNGLALELIKNFMSGYNEENSLSDFWLKKIMLFMRYRQIEALSWHLGYYPSKNFTAVVYNELFDIYFDFGQYIKDTENDVFFEECKINENAFINTTK